MKGNLGLLQLYGVSLNAINYAYCICDTFVVLSIALPKELNKTIWWYLSIDMKESAGKTISVELKQFQITSVTRKFYSFWNFYFLHFYLEKYKAKFSGILISL